MKLISAGASIVAVLSQLFAPSSATTTASSPLKSNRDIHRKLLAESSWAQLGQPISKQVLKDALTGLPNLNDLIGFGYSLSSSLDGKILAIGAPYDSHNAGSVTVYQYSDLSRNWHTLGGGGSDDLITSPGPSASTHGYYFGYDVALSHTGKILVVSAPRALDGRGFISVFRYDEFQNAWEKIGQDIEGVHPMEEFGTSVAVSENGNEIVVGAPRASSRPGSVRVYQYTKRETGFEEYVQLGDDILGESQNDRAGHSVDILSHGNNLYVAVGALMDLYTEGSVALYRFDSTLKKWDQHGSRVDGDEFGTEFGRSVSLGHDGKDVILAVGFPGPGVNQDSKIKSGAQVYNINNEGIWDFYGQLIYPLEEDDNTGYKVSLSIDGQTLAMSSPNYGEAGQGLVHVYYKGKGSAVYKRIGHGIEGGDESDELGYAIVVSRDGKVVSASTPDAQYVATYIIGNENDRSHLNPNSMSATAIVSLTFFLVCTVAILAFGLYKGILYMKRRRSYNKYSNSLQPSSPRSAPTYEISNMGGMNNTMNTTSLSPSGGLPLSPHHVIGEPDSDDEDDDGSQLSYDEEDNYESHLRRVTPDII